MTQPCRSNDETHQAVEVPIPRHLNVSQHCLAWAEEGFVFFGYHIKILTRQFPVIPANVVAKFKALHISENFTNPTSPLPSLKMLKLQPGLGHLLGFLPNFVVPSATVYLSLRLLQERLNLDIPSSLVIASTVLARPFLFVVTRYYTIWTNNRAAIANGAVLAPKVQESTFSVISALTNSIKNGYPGTSSVPIGLAKPDAFCRRRGYA